MKKRNVETVEVKNISSGEIRKVELEPPLYLVISLSMFIADIILNFINDQSYLSIIGVIYLIVGVIKSKKQQNFKIMYQNVIIIFLIDFAIQLWVIHIYKSSVQIGLFVAKQLSDQMIQMLAILGYIHLILITMMIIIMFYNIIKGKKREFTKIIEDSNSELSPEDLFKVKQKFKIKE